MALACLQGVYEVSRNFGWRTWSNDVMRIGQDRQREKLEHQRLPRSEQIVLSLFEFWFVRTCKNSCLCARVKGIRQRRLVRIAPCLSASLCGPFFSSQSDVDAVLTCPFCFPGQSLHDVHIPSYFLIQTRTVHGLQRFLRKRTE